MSVSTPVPTLPPSSRSPPPPGLGPAVSDRGTVAHEALRSERWTVGGVAKVAKDVEVGSADLDGTVIVGGALRAVSVTAVGTLEARGAVEVLGPLKVEGALEAGASVRAQEARLHGRSRIVGALLVEARLEAHGTVHAPSVVCGSLDLRGTAVLPEVTVAGVLEAVLDGDGTFGSIRAQEVRLRGPVPNLVRRILAPEPLVTVERIEAERVSLEGVRVGFVRSPEVFLGRSAHVGTVEGRVVRAHPSSRVGPESWSRPPSGLVR